MDFFSAWTSITLETIHIHTLCTDIYLYTCYNYTCYINDMCVKWPGFNPSFPGGKFVGSNGSMFSGRAEHGHGEDDRGHPREAGPLRQQRRGTQRMQGANGQVGGERWRRTKVRLESTDDQIRVYIHIHTYIYIYIYIYYICMVSRLKF